ncbi:hypothetical protein [Mesorhizobium sp. A623]
MDTLAANERYQALGKIYELDERHLKIAWKRAVAMGVSFDDGDYSLNQILQNAALQQAIEESSSREEQSAAKIEAAVEKIGAVASNALSGIEDVVRKVVDAKSDRLLQEKFAAAVETTAANRISEIKSSIRNANWQTWVATAVAAAMIFGIGNAIGNVNGRDNALITASEFVEFARDPASVDWIAAMKLNSPAVFADYCRRGSSNLEDVEGRLRCTVPLWVSGETVSPTKYATGTPRRVISVIWGWGSTAAFGIVALLGGMAALIGRQLLVTYPISKVLGIRKDG